MHDNMKRFSVGTWRIYMHVYGCLLTDALMNVNSLVDVVTRRKARGSDSTGQHKQVRDITQNVTRIVLSTTLPYNCHNNNKMYI